MNGFFHFSNFWNIREVTKKTYPLCDVEKFLCIARCIRRLVRSLHDSQHSSLLDFMKSVGIVVKVDC